MLYIDPQNIECVPGSSSREIGEGVRYQPIKSWMTLTWAGEGLEERNGDRSGCLRHDGTCCPPAAVECRVYWKGGWLDNPIYAALLYPTRRNTRPFYHWEVVQKNVLDDLRFSSEEEMENEIKRLFRSEKETLFQLLDRKRGECLELEKKIQALHAAEGKGPQQR